MIARLSSGTHSIPQNPANSSHCILTVVYSIHCISHVIESLVIFSINLKLPMFKASRYGSVKTTYMPRRPTRAFVIRGKWGNYRKQYVLEMSRVFSMICFQTRKFVWLEMWKYSIFWKPINQTFFWKHCRSWKANTRARFFSLSFFRYLRYIDIFIPDAFRSINSITLIFTEPC